LRRTQSTLEKKADYESWLGFFFNTLQKQKRYLEEQLGKSEMPFSGGPGMSGLYSPPPVAKFQISCIIEL
jgi:hypothetical protein